MKGHLVLIQIKILLFYFLFPFVCRSLASWWQVCMELTPSWRYGGGALAMAVRRQLRPASTCEHARHLAEKWRQDLSLRESLQTIRRTNEKPHWWQRLEMDLTSTWVFQGRAISSALCALITTPQLCFLPAQPPNISSFQRHTSPLWPYQASVTHINSKVKSLRQDCRCFHL